MIPDRKTMGFIAHVDECFFGDPFRNSANDVISFPLRSFRDAENRNAQSGA